MKSVNASSAFDEYKKLMKLRPEEFNQDSSLNIVTDEKTIENFCKEHNREVGVVYKSAYNMIVVDLVENMHERKFFYERLLPSVKGEAVVAIVKFKDKFIILDQFRHAARKSLFCFPRGYGEEGISAEDNVRKELIEELGIKNEDIAKTTIIGKTVANSGIAGEEISIALCEITNYNFKKSEEIEGIFALTESELDTFIANGLFYDGISTSAWAVYKAVKNKVNGTRHD